MPVLVELAKIPNQSLQMILAGSRYDITIKKVSELMVADIARDGEIIVEGMRCLPYTAIIPYRYKEAGKGNFFFVTEADQLTDYEQFGVTQYLWYFSNEELEVARAGS